MKTCLSGAGRWNGLCKLLITAILVMSAGYVAAQSDGVELNPAHPDTYVVKRGDTLWDISGMFLKDPWYWPEIWYVNPQVENPHLIYPGDVLSLVYVDGKPRIQVARGSASVVSTGNTERLSPQVRSEDLDAAIATIPFNVIEPFLSGGMIMSRDEADELPKVVALRDHLVAGAGHEIYVEGLAEDTELGSEFLILRVVERLRDPDTRKILGYEIQFIGNAELRANAEGKTPATLFVTKSDREIYQGDLIKVSDLRLPMNFFPNAPTEEVNGRIISVIDGVSIVGQYQMVILNRGINHGLQEGTVLGVWQTGETTRGYRSLGKKVTLPDTFAGNLMVVKAYDDISYALVMEAVAEMRVNDRVQNP